MVSVKVLAGTALLGASIITNAADGVVGPLNINALSLYTAKTAPRDAGTVTVTISDGFTIPPGVRCDTRYISTSRTSDPDRSLFFMLDQALGWGQTVKLIVTDDPALNAYPGRCSLKGVEVVSRIWIN